MSHPVKTRSSSWVIGVKFLMRGVLSSVRLPRRIVPIWVIEPIALAKPLRTASTPAMRVVATAPIPGIMIPNFPFAGLISAALGVAAPGVDMLDRTFLQNNFGIHDRCNLPSRVFVKRMAQYFRG